MTVKYQNVIWSITFTSLLHKIPLNSIQWFLQMDRHDIYSYIHDWFMSDTHPILHLHLRNTKLFLRLLLRQITVSSRNCWFTGPWLLSFHLFHFTSARIKFLNSWNTTAKEIETAPNAGLFLGQYTTVCCTRIFIKHKDETTFYETCPEAHNSFIKFTLVSLLF